MTAEQLDAFPDAKMDSPRLAWLKRHNLTTRRLENGRWRCNARGRTKPQGCGATCDEACIDFANKTGIRHWNLPAPIMEFY